MATRKDLLKAHSFTTARLVSALVDRNPDEAQPPLKRVGTATFVSILIAVVFLAGSALFGLLRKQVTADQWQKAGVVIMDSGSGSLFTWDEATKRLMPMNDVTSAKLAASNGGGQPELVTVKSSDLTGYAKGPRQGIPGAPFQLPLEKNITPFPLRVCATAPDSADQRFLTVQLGDRAPAPSGTVDIAAETPAGQYIIMNGRVHKLEGQGAESPLIGNLPKANVSETWLASLPVGNPIRKHEVPGAGGRPEKGPLTVGGLARIGEEDAKDVRYYIQLNDGLSRIAYLDMRLMVENGTPEPTPITAAQYSTASSSQSTFGTPDLPFGQPQGPANLGSLERQSVCATYLANEEAPSITIGVQTPTRPANMIRPLGNKADVIEMQPLTGAILQNQTLKGTHTATFLVTDSKIYGIPTMGDRQALGYSDKTPVGRVPAKLFDLFPSGLPAGKALTKADVAPL